MPFFRNKPRRSYRQLLLLAALIGVAQVSEGKAQPIIDITAFGELRAKPGRTIDASNTASGWIRETGAPTVVRRSNCIVAKPGTLFGIIVAHNDPQHPSYGRSLQVEVTHPPFTGPGGGSRTTDRWEQHLMPTTPRPTGWAAWGFDHDYELVPGPWTIAMSYNGEMLAKKSFEVVANRAACARTG